MIPCWAEGSGFRLTQTPDGRQKRLDDLYEYGKKKGTLTYKEIMERLMDLYIEPDQLDKVLELARLLTVYCGRMIVHIIPFTEIQEEIRRQCPEEYFTLIMRRFMMRIAQAIAKDHGAKCLATGENLGQVASQTMQSLAATNDVCTMPVYRPLIGFDKQEIVDVSEKIDTYETSIQPLSLIHI